MQFLKTLFWVLVAVVLAVFAFYNPTWVDVSLPSNITARILLPLLVIGAFVVGVLLVWIPHRASVWSWRRKVDATERKLVEERDARRRSEDQLLNERNRSSAVDPDPRLDTAELVIPPARDADGRLLDDRDRPL